MNWVLDKNRPVCPQICEMLCVGIVNGAYPPQGRLPSVRELAVALGVNPNTVQRALETMEEQGLLYSVRGSGWYVQEDTSRAKAVLHGLRMDKTAEFFRMMEALGMNNDEIKAFVKEWQYE